jgi:large subunit ribosomal protein L24e
MAAAREKQHVHRRKKLEAIKASVKLHEPIVVDSVEKTREKIKVPAKARSALIQGDGKSMDMIVD